jgi:hypothetical protein
VREKALPGLVVALLVSLMLGVGYRYLTSSRAVRAAGTKAALVLTADAKVWFTLPESAVRTDITIEPAGVLGLAGKALVPGSVLWGGWRVAEARPGEVRLVPAPGQKPVYLGVKDGYVAIFLGPPRLGLVAEVTGIRSTSLLPEDAARLAAGVGVPDLTHAWQMIQGLGQ